MVVRLLSKGKKIFLDPQESILSAATLIMFMIVASRILGLVRQRVLAHFFVADKLSLFFAAFRLPDLVFEVLVFGTFASAFIPVFTRSLREGKDKAWETAGIVVNIGLIVFILFSVVLLFQADFVYSFLAPGYSGEEREVVVNLARVLFAAQGFFVVSYVLTGVLESLKRFLVPALAPLFYNLGIILGTVFLAPKLGLIAPVIGVVIGSMFHFLIQLPLALRLGFRFIPLLKFTPEVKKIGKLAAPRVLETIFLQISKSTELFFSSLISVAAYTYYTFGNTLQLVPVGLFGTSIAKAALPTLASQSDSENKFKNTLFSTLYDMCFLIIPIATLFIVLRIPIIRLVYGTDIFDWRATTQTGYVLSAFALGMVTQSVVALLSRGFYALHDTKTPVLVSIISTSIIILLDFLFIKVLKFDVWGLAAAFSIGSLLQAVILFFLMNRKIGDGSYLKMLKPIIKSVISAFFSGLVMYFILKFFDRSTWIKRISFVGRIDITKIDFEKFVLDTRYTVNLLILTVIVALAGGIVYLGLSIVLKSDEVWNFFRFVGRILGNKKVLVSPKGREPLSANPIDNTSV